LLFFEYRINVDDNLPDCRGSIASGGIKEMVGLTQSEITKENFVEFVIVILAGMDKNMIYGS